MKLATPDRRSLRPYLLAVIASALALAVVAAPAAANGAAEKSGEKVRVMTRNVYLGADLNPAIGAPDLCAAIDGAGQIYNEVQRTNFRERAVPLGREIRRAKPHLVGLQEVALWRTQTPSDNGGPPISPDPNATSATDVEYDFLALLMRQLGKRYRVVGVQQGFDAELPANVDGNAETGGLCGAELDARLTMRDVILARKGVRTAKLRQGNYKNRYVAEISGIEVPADRGWLSTRAKVGDAKFSFVNTHLEAFGDPRIREAQAKELIRAALRGRGQRVLVGDLNSGLRRPHRIGTGLSGSNDDQLAYKALRKFGMKDRGAVQSCCFPSPLDDPSFRFDHTVDHILVKPKVRRASKSFVTGNARAQMTPSGLWPSDHGGVVSTLLFR